MNYALILGAVLGCTGFATLLPMLQPQAIAQVKQTKPKFTTQAELNKLFTQVKLGWTRQQVENLLGKPQWGTRKIYNYFLKKDGKRTGVEQALEFDQNGKVCSIGKGAG